MVGGQEFYSGEEGEETVLVVRASSQFWDCQAIPGSPYQTNIIPLNSPPQVSKDMMQLQVEFSAGQEICDGQICLGVIKSIPSCVLTVRQVSTPYRGHWLFHIRAKDMSGTQIYVLYDLYMY